jgi:hypothetical protein
VKNLTFRASGPMNRIQELLLLNRFGSILAIWSESPSDAILEVLVKLNIHDKGPKLNKLGEVVSGKRTCQVNFRNPTQASSYIACKTFKSYSWKRHRGEGQSQWASSRQATELATKGDCSGGIKYLHTLLRTRVAGPRPYFACFFPRKPRPCWYINFRVPRW